MAYEIYDWNDLDELRFEDDRNLVLLMNDLDQNTTGYSSVASPSANNGAGFPPIFEGSFGGIFDEFDGQGYEIRNFYSATSTSRDTNVENTGGENLAGLFQGLQDSEVRNLSIEMTLDVDETIYSGQSDPPGLYAGFVTLANRANSELRNIDIDVTVNYTRDSNRSSYDSAIGALIGYVFDGDPYTIINCSADIDFQNLRGTAGGLVGTYNAGPGTIKNSFCEGTIQSDGVGVGGMVGTIGFEGFFDRCLSTVSISGSADRVGGFTADGFAQEGEFINCAAITDGTISGNNKVGGFCASFAKNMDSCFAINDVSGNNEVGGFTGNATRGTIANCYSFGSTSGNDEVGGFLGLNQAEQEQNISYVRRTYVVGETSGSTNVGGSAGFVKGGNAEITFEVRDGADTYHEYSYAEEATANTSKSIGLARLGDDASEDGEQAEGGNVFTTETKFLTEDEMKGSTAKSFMRKFNFTEDWITVEDSTPDATEKFYPILRGPEEDPFYENNTPIDENAPEQLQTTFRELQLQSLGINTPQNLDVEVQDNDASEIEVFVPGILEFESEDRDVSSPVLKRLHTLEDNSDDSDSSQVNLTLLSDQESKNWLYEYSFIGNTIEEIRTWSRMELTLRYEKSVSESFVSQLISEATKVEVLENAEGGFNAIDLSNSENTFRLRPPSDEKDVRPIRTWLLSSYEKEVVDRDGNVYELVLELTPKNEKSFDNEYGTFDSEPVQTASQNEWLFEFTFGSIATDKVEANLVETPEGSVNTYEITVYLTPLQTRIYEENIGKLNLSEIRSVPDNPDVIDDTSEDDRNTVVVEPPYDNTEPLSDGEYVFRDWETEWRSGVYVATWVVAEE